MQYLEGETLASRLERGALPPADALKIAVETVVLNWQAALKKSRA